MRIECLFILRKAESVPELIAAWDEHSVEENPEGWESECNDVLRFLGRERHRSRYLTIEVPDAELNAALSNAEIAGKVVEDS